MALYVHHGPQLAPLATGLVERLAAPAGDPFERLVVAVPTAGVRDWLTRRIAADVGVAANIAMPYPGRFFAAAVGSRRRRRPVGGRQAHLGRPRRPRRGRRSTCPDGTTAADRLRPLAALRRRQADRRPVRPLRHDATGDPPPMAARRPRRRHGATHAGRRSSASRRRAHGRRTAAVDALAVRPVAARPQPHRQPEPGRAAPDRIEQLRRGELDPEFPATVELFGVNTVSRSQLDVLAALAAARDVHVSLLHPSAIAWVRTSPVDVTSPTVRDRRSEVDGDAATAIRCSPRGAARAPRRRPLCAASRHPRSSRRSPTSRTARRRFLEHIRADLGSDHPPTPFARPPSDTSIQVHACHGTIRQLEVMRDALGHLFAGDPTLRPDDVVVICPDLRPLRAVRRCRVRPRHAAGPRGRQRPVARHREPRRRGARRDPPHRRRAVHGERRARRRRPRTGAPPPGDHRGRPRPIRWLDAAARHEVGPRRRSPGRVARRRHRPRHVGAVTALVAPRGRRCRPRRRGSPSTASCRSTTSAATTSPVSVASPSWSPASAGYAGCRPGAARSGSGATSSSTPSLNSAPRRRPRRGRRRRSSKRSTTSAAQPPSASRRAASPLAFDDLLAVVDGVVAHRRGRVQLRTGRVTITGSAPVRNVPARVVGVLGFDERSLQPRRHRRRRPARRAAVRRRARPARRATPARPRRPVRRRAGTRHHVRRQRRHDEPADPLRRAAQRAARRRRRHARAGRRIPSRRRGLAGAHPPPAARLRRAQLRPRRRLGDVRDLQLRRRDVSRRRDPPPPSDDAAAATWRRFDLDGSRRPRRSPCASSSTPACGRRRRCSATASTSSCRARSSASTTRSRSA